MAQPVKRREAMESLSVNMSKAVKTGLAARVLNRALQGEELKPYQVTVALEIFRKMVPSLQAVAIELRVKEAQSQHDLAAEALAVGIDPRQLFDMPEKKAIEHESLGKPPTPGIDE